LRAHNRFETDRALRRALERDEFVIGYQPIVELATGKIVSFEALLRWDHPGRGLVRPAEFIELAEETGIIVPIGLQTLERACRQLQEWRTYPGMAELEMSVNVSAVQLRDREFPDHAAQVLDRVAIDPAAVMLEITESFLMEDSEPCLQTLADLKALGLRLAVDDFGIRYSSLGYLNSMPLEALKIDRVFIERLGGDPGDAAIVSAILAMADALGLGVIAEGVETPAQHAQLVDLGCRLAQGYRFSRPLRVADASALVRAGFVTVEDRAAVTGGPVGLAAFG
jgi:EAL domain-containing protein (putative c-di-GMP-specific phosphodiesterase class I)